MNKSAMYILIKDSVSTGHAVLAAAHASLSGYLTFLDYDLSLRQSLSPEQDFYNIPTATELWVTNSFRKLFAR